jgi:hypothetical protein
MVWDAGASGYKGRGGSGARFRKFEVIGSRKRVVGKSWKWQGRNEDAWKYMKNLWEEGKNREEKEENEYLILRVRQVVSLGRMQRGATELAGAVAEAGPSLKVSGLK